MVKFFSSKNETKKSQQIDMRVLLLDGGMGDEIVHRLGLNDPMKWSGPALFTPQGRDVITKLHCEFVTKNCDFVKSSNFSLREFNGFSNEEIEQGTRWAVRLAKDVVDGCEGVIRCEGGVNCGDHDVNYWFNVGESHVTCDYCHHSQHGTTTATARTTTASCHSYCTSKRPMKVLGSIPPPWKCFDVEASAVHKSCKDIDPYGHIIPALSEFTNDFICETLNSSAEAIMALGAVERHARKNSRVMIAFAVTATGTLFSGESATDTIRLILNQATLTPTAFLFNCCPPEDIDKALDLVCADQALLDVLKSKQIRLGAYPNRYPALSDTSSSGIRNELGPESFTKWCVEWIQHKNVSIVGGCCGITPDFIACLHNELRRLALH